MACSTSTELANSLSKNRGIKSININRCTLCHIVGIIGSLQLSWIDSIFFCFRWDVKIRGMINPTLTLN